MHRLDHCLVLMGTCHREYLREPGADCLGLLAHAAGHDHPAIFHDRLANRLEAFFLGRIEKAAGVDQHHVRAGIIGAHRIAIGAQPRQDAFGIDQRLGTAEADHADFLLIGKGHGRGWHTHRAPPLHDAAQNRYTLR